MEDMTLVPLWIALVLYGQSQEPICNGLLVLMEIDLEKMLGLEGTEAQMISRPPPLFCGALPFPNLHER